MNSTGAIVLAIALFIIMLGMGLSLTLADFQRIFKYPKAVFLGLTNQIVLLPLIAYVLVLAFGVDPVIAIGIMILSACPGGPTSNLITHLAKGDTALSVTLTALSSMVTILTIPFIVQFALMQFMGENQEVALNIPQIIGQLFVITIIPVSLGMTIKAKAPQFALRMDKPVKIASAIVLALVILGIVLKEKDSIVSYFQQAGIIALCLNVLTMFTGYFTAHLFKLSIRQAISISIESGIQNGTLAIAIATITLNSSQLAIAGAIYGLIMFFTGFAAIWAGGIFSKKEMQMKNA